MSSDEKTTADWIFATATVIWAIAVGLIARILLMTFAQQWGGKRALLWLESTPRGLAVGAITIQLALLALVAFRARIVPNLRARLLRATRERPSHWALALLFILGIAPFANLFGVLVAKLTGSDLESMKYVSDLIQRASSADLILLAIVLSLFPAVVEESLFRGLLLGSLSGLRVPFAIGLQALAFGLFHMDVAQGAATLVLGLGFGFIAQSTGSLKGSMLAHAGYNFTVLLVQRSLGDTEPAMKWQIFELTFGLVVAALAARKLYEHAKVSSGVVS